MRRADRKGTPFFCGRATTGRATTGTRCYRAPNNRAGALSRRSSYAAPSRCQAAPAVSPGKPRGNAAEKPKKTYIFSIIAASTASARQTSLIHNFSTKILFKKFTNFISRFLSTFYPQAAVPANNNRAAPKAACRNRRTAVRCLA